MLNDFRFALRLLRKNPGFAIVAVLILGLGIGGNTAIFSIVNAALLRPLPYREPDRLYAFKTFEPKRGRESILVAPSDFYAIAEQTRSFENVGAMAAGFVTLRIGERVVRQFDAQITPDFFRLLGVEPALGRGFTGDDSHSDTRLVVLGYDFWHSTLNADPSIIGKQIVVEGEPHTVIGVLGPSFRFPARIDIARPLHEDADSRMIARALWYALARLKPGVSIGNNLLDSPFLRV